MEFIETALKGAFLIRQKKIEDHRGYFARAWCREEFIQHGLNPDMLQLNTAFSFLRGTVRGMHYQEKPHEEAKLIRCTRGAIYDVIIDLRPDSPTCGQWHGEELTGPPFTLQRRHEACVMTLWLSAFSGRFRSRRYRTRIGNGRITGDEPHTFGIVVQH